MPANIFGLVEFSRCCRLVDAEVQDLVRVLSFHRRVVFLATTHREERR